MSELLLEQFIEQIDKIISAGGVPVLICECGYASWMYEGDCKYSYKLYTKQCHRCDSCCAKRLYGDFDAPEL